MYEEACEHRFALGYFIDFVINAFDRLLRGRFHIHSRVPTSHIVSADCLIRANRSSR